jgi:hypothetical protein
VGVQGSATGRMVYVCAVSATCQHHVAVGLSVKSNTWRVTSWEPHTCDWAPADFETSHERTQVEGKLRKVVSTIDGLRVAPGDEVIAGAREMLLQQKRELEDRLREFPSASTEGMAHRPYLPAHLAAGMGSMFQDGQRPTTTQVEQYISDRVHGAKFDDHYHRKVKQIASGMFTAEWELDPDKLPAYVEALRLQGHTVELVVKDTQEMKRALSRMMSNESRKRALDDPSKQAVAKVYKPEDVPVEDGFGEDGLFLVGWR